jgi:PPOX class probable F420-dependent enzyme
MALGNALEGEKYISLTTFRKNGAEVRTPVWFAEESGRLYVFSNPNAGKVKRIRNNPSVRLAACTFRGKITGAESGATARILPPEDWSRAREIMRRKYWLMRVPLLWSRNSVFIELSPV